MNGNAIFGTADRVASIDPVTFEVIRNALLNITEQMAVTIRRAAYSTNIKTRADFSCAFFDNKLRTVAQSFAQPAHLVSMAAIVPYSIKEIGAENIRTGDSYFVNDAHRGASHLNDITVLSPVDVGGVRLGYLANMAHHIDVGGLAPASLAVTTEIYQEGITLPPTRLGQNGGIDNNVLNMMLANVRAPRETRGDLQAQVSANIVGARRMAALVERYPPDLLEEFYDELINYTERWTDHELRKLPEGRFEAVGYRDDDGLSDEPVRLNMGVTIEDGHITLDVDGSSEQRNAPMNCTRPMARCTIAFVARCLVDNRLPVNEGFLRRIHITGRDGLVCTATRPAPVVAGWELCARMADLIFKALHPAMPDRIPAAGKGLIVNLGFGGFDPSRNEYFCYMETIAGGGGARPHMDGQDATQTNLQNTENAPIEEVELGYPIFIRCYELIEDSGGAGRYRGGMGVRRDFEFPYADCTCTVLSDGRVYPPWGLVGGHDGRPAHYILDPDGENRELPSKCTIRMPKGGCLRIETPGGGGFGDPAERDPASIERDRRGGKVTDRWIEASKAGASAR
jgi:N-methylhydantoinase B